MLVNSLMIGLLLSLPAQPDTWGHEPYEHASPLDVAVSPVDGHIYIARTAESEIVRLNRDFQPTDWSLALPGVTGVDVAQDGRVAAVSGSEDGYLVVVDPQGEELWRVGGTEVVLFNDLWGVAWGPAGNLFLFDAGAGKVHVLSARGDKLFEFGDYTWLRRYHSKERGGHVEEEVQDTLHRPCRGDFLPDGRLIIADYDGPILDPELNRRGGRFSVWKVDVAAKQATFERFLPPEPFPDYKAGDVCVDDATGEIYTAEADFPLTDHDFVRMRHSVDEAPRIGTNYFPVRFLTHPRGIALSHDGDVIVAEADKGIVFTLPQELFAAEPDEPNPLHWPKLLRMPVCERNRVVLEYQTHEPVVSEVRIAPQAGDWYDYPHAMPAGEQREVVVPARDARMQPLALGAPGRFHRVELAGLEPGQRYVFQYKVSERAYPGPLFSEPLLATTQPPAGKTQYLDAEVLVLLFTNLVRPADKAQVEPVPADPGPMTEEEIAGVKERMEWARRFYWVNSRGKFNVRFTYVIDDERYNPAPVHNWGYWPHDDHRRIDEILARHGTEHADVAGLCVIYGYRHWDDTQERWVLSGSGGNTWGSVHDGSAINAINAGGDTCWLFVHEYGHSMGINYEYSGQIYHFNHFHWNFLPTDYGAHYDGMAAMCREFKDIAYWANKYGRVVVVDDRDSDGLPDRDPNCAIDERGFGSDPQQADTDGDGLTDLEELMVTQGLQGYDRAFEMRQVEPVFEPDPTDDDADQDGVRDREDPYPAYPVEPEVHFANVTVDGVFENAEWPWRGFQRVMEDRELRGDVRLAWDWEHLYIGLRQEMQLDDTRPAKIYMELDANNDGMTVGADNIEMWLEPQADGSVQVRTKHNDTVFRMKPRWRDNILPSPQDIQAQWSRVANEFHLEIAIPQTKDAGLDLKRWEELGVLFQLTPEQSGKTLRLFEAQRHVDVKLR